MIVTLKYAVVFFAIYGWHCPTILLQLVCLVPKPTLARLHPRPHGRGIIVGIKILAQIIAWVGMIGSAIVGIIMIAQGSDMRSGGETLVGMSKGICVIIVGSLISWISSWFLYGFGELIEKTTEVARNTAKGTSSGSLATKIEMNRSEFSGRLRFPLMDSSVHQHL